jgi:hypothetical protein
MWVSFNLFLKHASSTKCMFLSSHHFLAAGSRADFHFFKRRCGKISSGVQAAPLIELWQGLGVRVKDFHTK